MDDLGICRDDSPRQLQALELVMVGFAVSAPFIGHRRALHCGWISLGMADNSTFCINYVNAVVKNFPFLDDRLFGIFNSARHVLVYHQHEHADVSYRIVAY